MSSGQSTKGIKLPKIPEIEALEIPSVFGTQAHVVNLGGLGQSRAIRTDKGIQLDGTLDPSLWPALNHLKTGLTHNTGYLNASPVQQADELAKGLNPYYNLEAATSLKQEQTLLGESQRRIAQTGLENSTARGAAEGQLASDRILRDLATRQAAMAYQRDQALRAATVQLDGLKTYANLLTEPLGLVNDNMQQALAGQNQINLAQAQMNQQNARDNANYQFQSALAGFRAAQEAQQRRASLLGGFMMPFTGALGSTLGRRLGGGGIL